MTRIPVAAFVIALGCASQAWGQASGTMGFDLPVQNTAVPGGSMATEAKLSGAGTLDYRFAGERVRLFYETSVDRFSADGTWSTWLHNTGLTGTLRSGKTVVDAGGALFWRANTGGWSEAGFRGLTLATSASRELDATTFSAGYAFYSRTFPDVSALDQLEHYGHARVLANLESRTTLLAGVSTGWKHYSGEAPIAAATADLEIGSQGSGRGRRWASGLAAPTPAAPGAARTQLTLTARIAQSLSDRTGIWVEHERRRTAGDAPPAVVWTPPLFYDDGVYDDPYAIDLVSWRAGVGYAFARGDSLRAWVNHSARDFVGVYAIDEDGNPGPLRSETLMRAGVEATIPLFSTAAVDVDLVPAYLYVRSQSNDTFERYRAHVVSAGVRAGF